MATRELTCDVLIAGGGTGGCAAAIVLAGSGLKVLMTEVYPWIGGQLTSQAVPPDEHPWIEQLGCTKSYRDFRNRVRNYYCRNRVLADSALADPYLNPGQGWVSRLCHEPGIAHQVLCEMLSKSRSAGDFQILYDLKPTNAVCSNDHVTVLTFRNTFSNEETNVTARYVLDATETGEILPLTGCEYRVGAESQTETSEQHATAEPETENVQGFTWCFAVSYDPQHSHLIEKPPSYEKWKTIAPEFWAGPLLSWNTIHAHTMRPHTWTLFGTDAANGLGLFDYRQIVSKNVILGLDTEDATIVNWPQNDYFLGSILDKSADEVEQNLLESRNLSLSLLYWLQNEAPRPNGGYGWPGLRLRGDLTGTADGLAQAPYIRESRRICARFTVCEQHVSTEANPGRSIAPELPMSVGIGAYRIDLHPSTNGRGTIDFSSLPFQIPLGSLIPIRIRNLIPACKNLGVTHITNGCYRLHPVEWNIGEVAGHLARFCVQSNLEPHQVLESNEHFAEFQSQLHRSGIETSWPSLGPL